MNLAPSHASQAQLEQTLGRNVARLLRGAWRSEVQSPKSQVQSPLSESELTAITPVLCRNGSGALAWYQIQNTPLADTAAGEQLHEVYRRFRLAALVHEREIAYVFSLLRAAGIEAVLVKGWAIARRYPDRALRPYGDIDLCVAPRQFAEAERALRCLESIEGHHVDLHSGFSRIGKDKSPKSKLQRPSGTPTVREGTLPNGRGSAWNRLWTGDSGLETDDLFSRSTLVECGGEPVRILCDEDHLRILSLHLLRSGAWRPAWLCDIALLLENVKSPPSTVHSPGGTPTVRKGARAADNANTLPNGRGSAWDRLATGDCGLQTSRVYANWVRTTIALAQQLLGANEHDVPSPQSTVHTPQGGDRLSTGDCGLETSFMLPRWLVPAVLKQWGKERVSSPQSAVNSEISVRRRWTVDSALWTSLYARWNNPVRATAAVGGEFNNWPRLPYRVAESFLRLRELPGKAWGNRGKGERVKGKAEDREQRSQDRRPRIDHQSSDLCSLTSDF